jgi:hypothetical protein
MHFIDKNSSFDGGVLIHNLLDFFDGGVKNSKT